MSQSEEFTRAMLDNYSRAGRETGYWGHYFLRSVRTHGGLETAKRMLAKAGNAGKTKGFHALLQAGRPDLSVEALVLSPRFQSLFTKAELKVATERLGQFPEYAHRRVVDIDKVFPETLPDRAYVEGAIRRVIVNAYERDPTARAACVRKHGTRCAVCELSFEEVYGDIGQGFIHVHHKKPLASFDGEYRIDPVRDLAPVCPNCHAMLHTCDPPLAIEELRQVLAAQAESRMITEPMLAEK